MADAIRPISVRRGYAAESRGPLLGAGPLHGAALAKELLIWTSSFSNPGLTRRSAPAVDVRHDR